MHSNSNHSSGAYCQSSYSGGIERRSDRVLLIQNITTGHHIKTLSWIMSGFILILAFLSAATSHNVSVILIPVFAFFVLVIAKAQRTRTEINFADRTISWTWEIGFFTRRKVYSFDDFETVEIKDTGTVIEGYSLPVFNIQLIGRRKQVEIYSTDDPEKAKAVRLEITDFLKNSDLLSTARRQ